MPRRGFVPKREVLPDPVYGTTIVTKLINQIMLDGKRGIAQSVCYDAFRCWPTRPARTRWKFSTPACRTFCRAWKLRLAASAARPIRSRSRSARSAVRPLALRWLVEFSRKRGEKTMAERLCAEIIDASNNTGAAVKRKEEMHRMAEANKAFAHYRW